MRLTLTFTVFYFYFSGTCSLEIDRWITPFDLFARDLNKDINATALDDNETKILITTLFGNFGWYGNSSKDDQVRFVKFEHSYVVV